MKPTKLIPLLFAGALMSATPTKSNAQNFVDLLDPPSFSRDIRIENYEGDYFIYSNGRIICCLYKSLNLNNLKPVINVDPKGVIVDNERIFTWKDLEQRVSPSNSNVVKMLPKPPIPSEKDVAYGRAAAAATTSAVAAGGEPTVYDLETEIINQAEDKDKDRRISYEEFYPALMKYGSKEEYLKDLKEIEKITMHLKEGGKVPELNGGVILLNVNGNWLKNEKGDTVYYKTFTDALVKASWISKEYKSKGKTADIRYWGSISNVPHPERSGNHYEPIPPSKEQPQSLDDMIRKKISSTYPNKIDDEIILEATRRVDKLTDMQKRGARRGEFVGDYKSEYLDILNLPMDERHASAVFTRLGLVYLGEEDYDMAIKVYQRALELDLNNTATRKLREYNLANAHKLSSERKKTPGK
ncbi:MAG TPA: hypothetical protein HA282_02215 [Nanoarchaeota archaeon]|nr:hypothetical protein [Nanoarchaeota archaeon]HIH34675.1 hypothetical protein [Nanoarchaeota archaeon]HIH51136.1 hypothetical protein [Nanoarchaeota archaeon]HIH66008.1 hypothetical protein [Nanoarchaeota archaeon]